MTIMTIEDMFKQNANSDGIPMFDKNAWADLNANYTKAQIKIGLADYIVKYKPKFPYMIVTHDSMKKRFYSLKNKNATDCQCSCHDTHNDQNHVQRLSFFR